MIYVGIHGDDIRELCDDLMILNMLMSDDEMMIEERWSGQSSEIDLADYLLRCRHYILFSI